LSFAARNTGDYTNSAGQYIQSNGFFAPLASSDPFLNGRRNMRLGNVNLGFYAYQGFEYNSNIGRSAFNSTEAITSNTILGVDLSYQFTRTNRITLTTGFGFTEFLSGDNPFGDAGIGYNILPGTNLAFDFRVGPVSFTIYDRVSIQPLVNSNPGISNQQIFGMFQNDFGIGANWRINSALSFGLNYNFAVARSFDETFSGLDRDVHSLQGTLTYSPLKSRWSTGLEGGTSLITYKENYHNNGTTLNLGAFFGMSLTKNTNFRVSGGLQTMSFDNNLAVAGTTQDADDLSSPYFTFTLNNQINSRVTQTVSLGYESALSMTTNAVTSFYANYGISLIAWRGSKITTSAYYESSEYTRGIQANDLVQYGFDINWNQRLNSRTSLNIGYHFGILDFDNSVIDPLNGNINSANSLQHGFNADLRYQLTQRTTCSLGYRYFTSEFDNSDFTFDQHRVTAAIEYNY
jgi:hypothetical protein